MDMELLKRLGAKTRLVEIDREREELIKILNGRPSTTPEAKGVKRKSRMTAAGRKALSTKLKAYWAKRKAEGLTVGAKKK